MVGVRDVGDRLAALLRAGATPGGLLPPGGRLLVAVSGGRDSVALAHALHALAPSHGWALRLAHFDHGLRPSSGEDAAWVAALGQAWGVPVSLGRRRSPTAMSRQAAAWSEQDARRHRYRFLRRAGRRWHADRIALAHHAGDQAETMLLHLARGAGTRGASGMPARRGRFVRPWLEADPAWIAAYVDAHRLAFREDPTNRDERLARNAIRRRVMPEIDRLHPGAAARMAAAAARLRADDRLLERLARRRLAAVAREAAPGEYARLDAGALQRLPGPLRARALRRAYAQARAAASRAKRRLPLAPAALDERRLARLGRLLDGGGGRRLALPGPMEARLMGPFLVLGPPLRPGGPSP